jgi:MSHA biogenesis protein MshG
MTQYSYQARNREGRAVDGVLEAADPSAVAAMLGQTGMTPIRIAPLVASSPDVGRQLRGAFAAFQDKVPREELMHFCRQMHTLLRSGVPITRALAALEESSIHRGFSNTLNDLRQKLEGGRELSNAMQSHEDIFDAYFRSMVRMGETTGRLDETFLRLFEHLEFDKDMKHRIKAATRYPSFVLLAIAGAMTIINLFVIPAFAKVYESFHAELPVVTRLLIAISSFTVNEWPWLLGITAVLGMGARSWLRSVEGAFKWDFWMLHVPIMGKLVQKALLARFARSLALALRGGLQVTEALQAATQTTDNRYVRRKLESMQGAIDRGETLASAARQTGVFTPIVLQMISVGEESGTVDELLSEVALAYQSDVAYELKNLSDAIEPLLIVVLGVMVLVLALGVFLPMWDLGRAAMGGKSH